MNLISFNQYEVNIVVTHAEFELLRGYVLHAAEYDPDMPFNYPQLLAAFREIPTQIQLAQQEGFLGDE